MESIAVDTREIFVGCWLVALWGCQLTTKRTRKNSSRKGEGINALLQVIGQWVTESLGGGIDSREEIDLWLLHIYNPNQTFQVHWRNNVSRTTRYQFWKRLEYHWDSWPKYMKKSVWNGQRGCPRGVMVKAMNCGIVVSKFELQSCYYIHFRTNTLWERYEPPYPPSYGLNSTTIVLLGE